MKKKTNNQFVKDFKHLKKLIKLGHTNYALVLGGGKIGAFSRKTIKYNRKTKLFSIINHIDDTKQVLTEKQIKNKKVTHVGTAIPLKSLIAIIE